MNETFDKLKPYELIYLGTPYTKYPHGIHAAFNDAAELMAELIRDGLRCYSPIVHCHPIAIHGNLDPLDHKIWLPFNSVMMRKSDAFLIAMMESWEDSTGIQLEIVSFRVRQTPVFYLNPVTWVVSERPK